MTGTAFNADLLAGLRAKGLVKPAPLLSAETVAAFEAELRSSLRAGLTKIMEAGKARAQAETIPEPAPALTEDYGRAMRLDDPAKRPASFDKALTDALPTLRKFARKLCRGDQDRFEDLVNETMVVCLRSWTSYRPNDASIATWACWLMRSMNYHQQGKARRRAAVTGSIGDRSIDDLDNGAVASGLIAPHGVHNQDHAIQLKTLLADIGEVTNGDMLFRQAMGEELVDIARELGVSRQAIFQRVQRARRDLVATYRLKAEDVEGLAGRL